MAPLDISARDNLKTQLGARTRRWVGNRMPHKQITLRGSSKNGLFEINSSELCREYKLRNLKSERDRKGGGEEERQQLTVWLQRKDTIRKQLQRTGVHKVQSPPLSSLVRGIEIISAGGNGVEPCCTDGRGTPDSGFKHRWIFRRKWNHLLRSQARAPYFAAPVRVSSFRSLRCSSTVCLLININVFECTLGCETSALNIAGLQVTLMTPLQMLQCDRCRNSIIRRVFPMFQTIKSTDTGSLRLLYDLQLVESSKPQSCWSCVELCLRNHD
ncbi:hypothetical protein J6590_032574 [Homalodisca vitripennis]|nr:hypothetical protein J6590_032574 [Homalodisca vitripennis]